MNEENDDKKFETVVLEAIDEALSSLGENAKKTIYFHLERTFLIPKAEIPNRIEDFSDALDRIFGAGARHLEILIMKNLNQKVHCSYRWEGPKWLVPDLTFKRYIELARVEYEDEGKIEVIVDAGERQEQRH